MKRKFYRIVAALAVFFAVAACLAARAAAEPILGGLDISPKNRALASDADIESARARFQSGDFDGALRALRDAVPKNADMAPAEVLLAEWYAQAGMSKEACSALEQAVKSAPEDPEACVLLARRALLDGDAAKAEELLDEAGRRLAGFHRSPRRKELLERSLAAGYGAAAEARQDWDAAMRHWETWHRLDPKNAAPLLRLAYCLCRLKDSDRALEKLREAAAIDPTLLKPEALLAQIFLQAGDREGAKKWMAAAAAAAPKDFATRLAAAEMAMNLGEFDAARDHATAALRTDAKSAAAQFLLGTIAMFKREYETAEMYFEKLTRRYPDNVAYSNNLAMALAAQDDETKRRQAVEYAEANAKRYPKSADAASTYGWTLYRVGRLDAAAEALRGAESITARDPDTAYIIARVAADQGRKDKALPLLEEAVKSERPFLFREETEELLGELRKRK